jgi:hypothetical protein
LEKQSNNCIKIIGYSKNRNITSSCITNAKKISDNKYKFKTANEITYVAEFDPNYIAKLYRISQQ